jgi:hypothetical protein
MLKEKLKSNPTTIRVSSQTKERLDKLLLEKALKESDLNYSFDKLISELLDKECK